MTSQVSKVYQNLYPKATSNLLGSPLMEVVVELTTLHGKTYIVTIQPKSPWMKYVELKDFSIGTWNVRSLYRTGHLTTVISNLERYQLNIAAIQETRWPGKET